MPARVALPRQEEILAPIARDTTMIEFRWGTSVISGNDIDRVAIGRQPQGVRTMFTSASKVLELHQFVVLVVSVGVARSIESASGTSIDRDVQVAEGMEQALRRRDGDLQRFDLRHFVRTNRRGGDAEQPHITLVA